MSGVTVLRMAKMASLASSYAVMRGGTTMALGARRMATAMGMAECTPNGLTSYEAASTTPRRGSPPTITGLPRSSGESRCSTDAKNASMSRWMMAVGGTQRNGSACRRDQSPPWNRPKARADMTEMNTILGIGFGCVGRCSLRNIHISDISCGCDLVKAKGRFFRLCSSAVVCVSGTSIAGLLEGTSPFIKSVA